MDLRDEGATVDLREEGAIVDLREEGGRGCNRGPEKRVQPWT